MIAMPEITATPRTFDALPGCWSRSDGADGVTAGVAQEVDGTWFL